MLQSQLHPAGLVLSNFEHPKLKIHRPSQASHNYSTQSNAIGHFPEGCKYGDLQAKCLRLGMTYYQAILAQARSRDQTHHFDGYSRATRSSPSPSTSLGHSLGGHTCVRFQLAHQ